LGCARFLLIGVIGGVGVVGVVTIYLITNGVIILRVTSSAVVRAINVLNNSLAHV